jgi:hypothetical protein
LLRLHFQHGLLKWVIAYPSACQCRRVHGEDGSYLPAPGCCRGGKGFLGHGKTADAKAEGRLFSSWVRKKILSNEDIEMTLYTIEISTSLTRLPSSYM